MIKLVDEVFSEGLSTEEIIDRVFILATQVVNNLEEEYPKGRYNTEQIIKILEIVREAVI